MPDYGFLDTGFVKKPLTIILEDNKSRIRSVSGFENINLEPESPDGEIVSIISEGQAELWDLMEALYMSLRPSQASGAQLDTLLDFNGLTRGVASATTVSLNLRGDNSVVVPAGSLVSDPSTGAQFSTDTEVTLLGSGVDVPVNATCTETGPVQASTGTITQIDTLISGWTSVTNPSSATPGEDRETDAETRSRRNLSVARFGKHHLDQLYAELLELTGVIDLNIIDNDTDSTDVNSVPANTFAVGIEGGDDDEIAAAIFSNKPAGVPTYGSTNITVTDSQGVDHTVNFLRPTLTDIYITVNVTTNSAYPLDGDDLIKQALVDWANGDLYEGKRIGMGDTVRWSELFGPCHTVPGHSVTSILLDTSSSPAVSDDLAPTAFVRYVISSGNIVVNS